MSRTSISFSDNGSTHMVNEVLKPVSTNLLLEYKDIIQKTAKLIPFKSIYEFRPDVVSMLSYGEPHYSWLICYINDVSSYLKFTTAVIGANILIPDSTMIMKLETRI
jgi:hypothetical protein